MRTGFHFRVIAAAILASVILGGCGTAIKATAVTYTFEPRASFAELKTYRWADPKPRYRQDPLLESNVRFLADRAMEAKGLTSRTDKADLLVSMAYEFEYSSYGSGYELNMLTLNVSRADNNQLVWRGMATGSIKTDAASDGLKKAVEGMLVNFPPK